MPSAGAPAADAVAALEVVDGPIASKLAVPATVRLRCVDASTEWFAIVSASATPIAAEPPVVSPVAVVAADAVSVA